MRVFARRPCHTDPIHERSRVSPLIAPMLSIVSVFAIACAVCPLASAVEPSAKAMQSLDEQVQEIKSDVLGIGAELSNLEEKLLYPSTTQVALFVSLEKGDSLELDSVHISIDGKNVVDHIYSFKELEALRKGGVQRIYTGNVRTGKHQLDVSVAGRTTGGRDVSHSQTFAFEKHVDPKLVGISLGGGATGDATIGVGDW